MRSVLGIVLAAGKSSRMGRSKALLPAPGHGTFIARAAALLRDGGCAPVFAIVAARADDAARAAEAAGARVLHNPQPESEPIDSLRIALTAAPPHVAGALVLPVDHPLTDVRTVQAILAAFGRSNAPILRAAYQGAAGHPTLFARALWPELFDPALAHGARSVIERRAGEVEDVDVADSAVVIDLDTPADVERWSTPP